ncbi:hypothetical protein ACTA71_011946 [Dictyostelium dimigraforme]
MEEKSNLKKKQSKEIIDSIEENYKKDFKTKKEQLSNLPSILRECSFLMDFKNVCKDCSKVKSMKSEILKTLHLEVKQDKQETIETLTNNLLKSEGFDSYCIHCDKNTNSNCQENILELPNVFILGFQRSTVNGQQKINSPIVLSTSQVYETIFKEKYNIDSIAFHIGTNPTSGHYNQ